ncbi:MAG: acyltransferase, partial [Campylobacterales bacterium]|nr:acyltransferase [Campylobacterales bacterium]
CVIGHGSYLSAKEGRKLVIGANCMFSRNVKIMTSDGHSIFKSEVVVNHAKDILIGSHVWLADNVTIMKGVTIGEGSVVGINSTLTKSIPSKSIAVGNPAKVIKGDIEWMA